MGCLDRHTTCEVFNCKDFCGSTALGILETVEMNVQIDWKTRQLSHLLCSLARQMYSEAWRTFWTQTGQSITLLTPWRWEERRKEAANIPPSEVGNDLYSTRQTVALFRGKLWETTDRWGRVGIRLTERYDAIISRNWNWILNFLTIIDLVIMVQNVLHPWWLKTGYHMTSIFSWFGGGEGGGGGGGPVTES